MKAYGNGSVRRWWPLGTALSAAAHRLTCWRTESKERNPGRFSG
ncbi:hypothetical protein ACI2K4_33480 [Micromonospora sp. NPDC050397]